MPTSLQATTRGFRDPIDGFRHLPADMEEYGSDSVLKPTFHDTLSEQVRRQTRKQSCLRKSIRIAAIILLLLIRNPPAPAPCHEFVL